MKGCLKTTSFHSPLPSPLPRTSSSGSCNTTPTYFNPSHMASSSSSPSSLTPSGSASHTPIGSTSHSLTNSPTSSCVSILPCKKTVAFGADGTEEVYVADEWDRTPMEPARKLTYQDILELKEIQRSLPRACQPPDLLGSGHRTRHYLSGVPVGLLPLFDSSSRSHSSYSSASSSDVDSSSELEGWSGSSAGSSLDSSVAPSPCGGSSPVRCASPDFSYVKSGQTSGRDMFATKGFPESTATTTTSAKDMFSNLNLRAGTTPCGSAYSSDGETKSPADAWGTISFKRGQQKPVAPSIPFSPASFSTSLSPSSPSFTSSTTSAAGFTTSTTTTPCSVTSPTTTSQYTPPSHMAHLVPQRPQGVRPRPAFAFLPLLDSGSSSPCSMSNAMSATDKEAMVEGAIRDARSPRVMRMQGGSGEWCEAFERLNNSPHRFDSHKPRQFGFGFDRDVDLGGDIEMEKKGRRMSRQAEEMRRVMRGDKDKDGDGDYKKRRGVSREKSKSRERRRSGAEEDECGDDETEPQTQTMMVGGAVLGAGKRPSETALAMMRDKEERSGRSMGRDVGLERAIREGREERERERSESRTRMVQSVRERERSASRTRAAHPLHQREEVALPLSQPQPQPQQSQVQPQPASQPPTPTSTPKKKKERRFILINDMEIELDDDEEEEVAPVPVVVPTPPPVVEVKKKERRFIVVNDMEIELDDD